MDKSSKSKALEAKGKYKEAMSNFRREDREEKSFDKAYKAKGGKKAHIELASEYRAGKHSFKHPKNATKLAEMHERSAKGY